MIRFEGITKRFPGVTALADVTFEIRAGDCHAIMGENGAGKSTLGKIVAGIYQPDAGRLHIAGRPVRFRAPLNAASAGIAIVHQELAFCPNLSVAENLFLGRMPTRTGGRVRWSELRAAARGMLDAVGLTIDPDTPMERLSTGQEQMVQIAAAIGRRARIVVMDEPTSSLSHAEAERLFEQIERLKRDGVTILYVSHRLEEITRLCTRLTVLRDGRFVRTLDTASTSTDEVVRLMIGRPVSEYFPRHLDHPAGPILLSVRGLSTPRFNDVSFDVRAGEIVGMAGLVGAGRSEVARSIFGVDRASRGTVSIEGRPARITCPIDAIERGIGYLPEDRKRQGLVLTMSCEHNLTLAMLRMLTGRLLVSHRRERELSLRYFEELRVRAPSPASEVAGLSGGNQQKIALAKWLARDCRVLILDEPTRGVDVGAKAEIHRLIDQLAAEGRGVLLISSELPEILNLSTRVLVMAGGRIVGELSRAEATSDRVLRLMANVA